MATERDRKEAVKLLRQASTDGLIQGPAEPGKQPEMVARIADALAAERKRARAPFLALFSGGPDTVCRTTWRASFAEHVECVEVPMADLREAFEDAEP